MIATKPVISLNLNALLQPISSIGSEFLIKKRMIIQLQDVWRPAEKLIDNFLIVLYTIFK